MNTAFIALRRTLAAAVAAASLAWAAGAQAHCDTLDGPVVGAARQALDSGNVNLVLGWVQKKDEAEVRNAFQKAVAVRKTGAAAKDLADMYFFETLVRVHRAGEGAPYTGLKPAGEIEPSIALADKSIETGKLEPVANALTERMHQGLHKQFEAVVAKKSYKPGDVAATRAYVQAYVPYVHYVERLYDAAGTGGPAHGEEKPAPGKPAAHAH
jgi:hypothetical protein